eukprot:gene21374-biopygen8645
MSWVGPPAIRPRNHTPGGDALTPFYVWGWGPRCTSPNLSRGRVTIRLEATTPARFTAPYVWGWGPSYTSPPHGR